ncbi:heme exporter protein CcmD [Necropsobacter massiliensis]|uniref:heme exporter protein CcmD n=1 Tax=Necropsobacter massiliensis TaxID=1400001 RepID=UPI0005961ED6|nr:heme exporter protein CcmD [Necropsobacter massiliensis]
MFFQSVNDFIRMGGYGFYVWLAYGISFFVILALIIQSAAGKNALFKDIKRQQQREQRRQSANTGGIL